MSQEDKGQPAQTVSQLQRDAAAAGLTEEEIAILAESESEAAEEAEINAELASAGGDDDEGSDAGDGGDEADGEESSDGDDGDSEAEESDGDEGGEAGDDAGDGEGDGDESGSDDGSDGEGGDGDGEHAASDDDEGNDIFMPSMATSTEDVTEQLAEANTAKAELHTKFADGELTTEEYTAELDKVSENINHLNSIKMKAEIAGDFNSQMQQQMFAFQRKTYLKSAAKDGVDYKNAEFSEDFDNAFNALAVSKRFKDLDISEVDKVFEAAHNLVMAQHGIKAGASVDDKSGGKPGSKDGGKPASNKSKAAQAAEGQQSNKEDKSKGNPPKTLGDMPAAEQNEEDDPVYNKMQNLEGEELEKFMAGLSKSDHNKLMKRLS